ncbi:hypothetical protein O1611_g8012 [Lasiodiplodia mahajangana]|uniref:Uncharacterized protein n=1 Tax=Lasiodiplodia mahajangana TaxID=1108764 RepID=A0ACC2JDS7_9PEZI|nr:hypothetical protein O1611_g8012 [Lasiodiplodia mahajangana]
MPDKEHTPNEEQASSMMPKTEYPLREERVSPTMPEREHNVGEGQCIAVRHAVIAKEQGFSEEGASGGHGTDNGELSAIPEQDGFAKYAVTIGREIVADDLSRHKQVVSRRNSSAIKQAANEEAAFGDEQDIGGEDVSSKKHTNTVEEHTSTLECDADANHVLFDDEQAVHEENASSEKQPDDGEHVSCNKLTAGVGQHIVTEHVSITSEQDRGQSIGGQPFNGEQYVHEGVVSGKSHTNNEEQRSILEQSVTAKYIITEGASPEDRAGGEVCASGEEHPPRVAQDIVVGHAVDANEQATSQEDASGEERPVSASSRKQTQIEDNTLGGGDAFTVIPDDAVEQVVTMEDQAQEQALSGGNACIENRASSTECTPGKEKSNRRHVHGEEHTLNVAQDVFTTCVATTSDQTKDQVTGRGDDPDEEQQEISSDNENSSAKKHDVSTKKCALVEQSIKCESQVAIIESTTPDDVSSKHTSIQETEQGDITAAKVSDQKKYNNAQKAKEKDRVATPVHLDPIRILVVGPIGSGKSSFVAAAAAASGRDIKISHEADSCTLHCTEYPTKYSSGNKQVFLVDTPGFEDPKKADADTLEQITKWIEGASVSGVVYLHRCTDTRFDADLKLNFEVIKAMCGPAFYSRIVICSTFWNIASQDKFQQHKARVESFLADASAFGEVMQAGAEYREFWHEKPT